MIWRILGATVVFAIVYVGWLIFGFAGNAVNNQILAGPLGSASINGFTIGQMITQVSGLFAAGTVAVVVFLASYLVAAAHAEEDDSGIITG